MNWSFDSVWKKNIVYYKYVLHSYHPANCNKINRFLYNVFLEYLKTNDNTNNPI